MCCKDVHTCAQLVLTVSTLVSLRWLTACYRDVENWVRRLPNCANLWSAVTGFGQSANCMALLGFRLILGSASAESMICISVFGDAIPQNSASVWCPNGNGLRVNFSEKVPLTGLFSGTTFISAPSPRTKSFRSEVLRGNEFSEEAKFGRSLGSDAYSQAGDLACEVPCRMGRRLPQAKSERRYG